MTMPSPSKRRPIPWHRRLEARVVISVSLLVALSLGAILLITARVVTTRALTRASSDLEDTRSAFYSLVDRRADFAASQMRLITSLPAFGSSLTDLPSTTDVAMMSEMADVCRQRLDAQFCLMTDGTGKWIGSPGWPQDLAPPTPLSAGIAAAVAGRSRRDIVSLRGQLFLVVSEPMNLAEKILGTMTTGYALDDAVVKDLAEMTRGEISLVSTERLSASSLPPRDQADLTALLAATRLSRTSGVSSEISAIGGREFVHGVFPLFPDRPSEDLGQLVLLEDWSPTQQVLDEIRNGTLLAGAASLVLALMGALAFSRRMNQPLQNIAEAAWEIAGGDWSRRMSVRGGGEAATVGAAFNDMTASLRHSYEEAREEADSLELSYRRFSSITESTRDAIVSTDDRGVIIFWNSSAQTMFGYAECEILGRMLIELIADRDRAKYLEAIALAGKATGGLMPGGIVELTGERKDGSQFSVELSLAGWPVGDEASITAVIRDVTERRSAQEALSQRENKLFQVQKMEAIGQLAGGVAHDFDNLLTTIQGRAEALIGSLQPDDARRRDAEEILKATDLASGLTRQLLTFSRREMTSPSVVALDQVFAGTEKMLRRLVGADINLITSVQPDLGRVRADTGKMEQVLMNLVVNASDAMAGGGTLRIEMKNVELDAAAIAAHQELRPGAYVALTVADTGAGTDPVTAARIFEPFLATKGRKGTGLGLASVYGIVQQSGGAIEVCSEPGRGTTFRVYLPQIAGEVKVAGDRVRPSTTGSETVLLVEDDEGVRVLVANLLRKKGYTVLVASQGDQAVEIASRLDGPIHLLLTDVVMPAMSGRQLAERLTGERPDTPVLYMSGYSDDAVRRHGVRSAGAHFIQKPFSGEALSVAVREALAVPPQTLDGRKAGSQPRV